MFWFLNIYRETTMVEENSSESLQEAFRKHKNGEYRPHKGPSGKEFEDRKGGDGQEREKPSHSQPEHEFGTSQSLEETFKPNGWGRIKQALFSPEERTINDYRDLAEELEGEHGSIDPREHKVGPVQDYLDEKLEEGDYQMVKKVLAAEQLGDQRKTVLEYVNESDLTDIDPEQAREEIGTYNNKKEFAP